MIWWIKPLLAALGVAAVAMGFHLTVGKFYEARGFAEAEGQIAEIAKARDDALALLKTEVALTADLKEANTKFAKLFDEQKKVVASLKAQRDAEFRRVAAVQKQLNAMADKARLAEKSFDDLRTGTLSLQQDCDLMMKEMQDIRDGK